VNRAAYLLEFVVEPENRINQLHGGFFQSGCPIAWASICLLSKQRYVTAILPCAGPPAKLSIQQNDLCEHKSSNLSSPLHN